MMASSKFAGRWQDVINEMQGLNPRFGGISVNPEEIENAVVRNNQNQMIAGGLIPRIGNRLNKFGEQFTGNVPGLTSTSSVTNPGDTSRWDDVAMGLIQAGGRVAPVAGALWFGLNAGNTAAGTIEDARRRGYIK